VLRDAVWWTRIRPGDQDVFRLMETSSLRLRLASLACITGSWQGQPAYSSPEFIKIEHKPSIDLVGTYAAEDTGTINLSPLIFLCSKTCGHQTDGFFGQDLRGRVLWHGDVIHKLRLAASGNANIIKLSNCMSNQLTPETPDAELVRLAKAGELDAFEALTNRYEQRVYGLAMRMLRQEQDAEDVTQHETPHFAMKDGTAINLSSKRCSN
jgi:hypothetical protein